MVIAPDWEKKQTAQMFLDLLPQGTKKGIENPCNSEKGNCNYYVGSLNIL